MSKFKVHTNIYIATIYQWALAVLFLWLSRFLFIYVNAEMVHIADFGQLMRTSLGGLSFDIVAATYFNLIFILMRILPFEFASNKKYLRATNIIFFVCTSIMLIVQFADTAYFRFSGTRLRFSGLQEVMTDTNILGILVGYLSEFWWVAFAIIATVALLIWLYTRVAVSPIHFKKHSSGIITRSSAFILLAGASFLCIRGHIGAGKPLNIADAIWHTNAPEQINAVLNSPFTLIRSIGKDNKIERLTYYNDTQLNEIRSSVHLPSSDKKLDRKNIMFIILESGGSCFIDYFNRWGDNEREKVEGLMPFTDSIARQSLVFTNIVTTGKRSNEGITAILGSFPAFEPMIYMLSPYNSNKFDSPANLLLKEGYKSAFFCGCNPGSFNIDQFAEVAGFKDIYDRSKYPEPNKDFDGKWGIFDVPMAKFVANTLSSYTNPWIAAWFSISAHSPFSIPDSEDPSSFKFKSPTPQRGLEYTDRAVRTFFEIASKQAWYKNTIFVITGDHGNRDMQGTRFDTPYIQLHVPLMIYAPGAINPEVVDNVAGSQFDIGPTLLSIIGYDKTYVSVGNNLLKPDLENYGISFVNNQYIISSPKFVVITDSKCKNISSVYNVKEDPELTKPLPTPFPAEAGKMLKWAKGFLQDYTTRINDNALSHN